MNIKKINTGVSPLIEVKSLKRIEKESGNIYESIYIIGKRADQIAGIIREELHHKLSEFATHQDNLEEVFENREQIEISKHYEKMPKPTVIALEEFLHGEVYFRRRDIEENHNE